MSSGSRSQIRIAIWQRRLLDLDGLAELISNDHRFALGIATTELTELLDYCARDPPTVSVLDTMIARSDVNVFDVARRLLRDEHTEFIFFVDDFPNQLNAKAIFDLPRTAYFTRQSDFRRLTTALLDLVAGRKSVEGFTEVRDEWSVLGERQLRVDSPLLAELTLREKEVMQLLAAGRSVRQCAEMLHLAESTVDNHKAKLMKKLGVHKSAELALLAVRSGLVSP